jgi:tRNA dimethylallyltransferase
VSVASPSPNIIIITGPTGTGKTAVAVELARLLSSELISADSMQVYKHLSVGTAKPTVQELKGVPCHLIDYIEPDHQYNLGRFLEDAEHQISRLQSRGKIPIVCGGTGMYLRGLMYGVLEDGGRDQEFRRHLEERVHEAGLAPLYEELVSLDPNATHISRSDRQRILRALEVIHCTGKPISALQTQHSGTARYEAAQFILDRPRTELYDRINERTVGMLNNGLLDEVRQYLQAGYSESNPAVKALGYAEMIEHVKNGLSLTTATASMQQRSRNYAKRQETWFRAMKDAVRIPMSGKTSDDAAREILKKLRPANS